LLFGFSRERLSNDIFFGVIKDAIGDKAINIFLFEIILFEKLG
jgi:hypothetical protein